MKHILIISILIIGAFFAGNATSTSSGPYHSSQVHGVSQEITSVSPEQFNALISTSKYELLDIRTAEEYAAGHINNAKQNDYYQTQAFSDYLDTLDKKKKYFIYCRTGKRSNAAVQIMQNKGFENIIELSGGFNEWVAAGLPVTK